MAGNLSVSADIAVSGMKAQAERLRVISENMANADSVGIRPGEDPYRRQVVTFKNYVDEAKEAQRSYDANMSMMQTARDMNSKILDVLK